MGASKLPLPSIFHFSKTKMKTKKKKTSEGSETEMP